MTRTVRRAYWSVYAGLGAQLIGLVWAGLGGATGRWLVAAGLALAVMAVVAGLWLVGWRELAVACALFLTIGTASVAIVTATQGLPTAPGHPVSDAPSTCGDTAELPCAADRSDSDR